MYTSTLLLLSEHFIKVKSVVAGVLGKIDLLGLREHELCGIVRCDDIREGLVLFFGAKRTLPDGDHNTTLRMVVCVLVTLVVVPAPFWYRS